MTDCIIGVQKCGCITYANAEPDRLDRDDERAIARIVKNGGSIERLSSDEARKRPHFLVGECPHDPTGWEREQPKEPNRLRYKRNVGRNLSIVNVVVERWPSGFRGGEVGKRDGAWWATEGWLDDRTATATDGKSPRGPADVFGPFKSQREAAETLIPFAEKRSAELLAKWAEQRAAKQEAVRA